jgi:hypothetical protein
MNIQILLSRAKYREYSITNLITDYIDSNYRYLYQLNIYYIRYEPIFLIV